ncbi:unnamed protein product [Microthlaspi erraticum]|uniref:Uncharacterized protein n=1 Tax=Microthlaspi erraticum TaxID=1685480 RepID=A0A6D2IZV1_9BRAS|nr:unnamed protein product [Microthlaspi erraticum]
MDISSIATYDWPEPLPSLLTLHSDQNSIKGVDGALRCLAFLSGDLDDKEGPTLVPVLFPCLHAVVSSPQFLLILEHPVQREDPDGSSHLVIVVHWNPQRSLGSVSFSKSTLNNTKSRTKSSVASKSSIPKPSLKQARRNVVKVVCSFTLGKPSGLRAPSPSIGYFSQSDSQPWHCTGDKHSQPSRVKSRLEKHSEKWNPKASCSLSSQIKERLQHPCIIQGDAVKLACKIPDLLVTVLYRRNMVQFSKIPWNLRWQGPCTDESTLFNNCSQSKVSNPGEEDI